MHTKSVHPPNRHTYIYRWFLFGESYPIHFEPLIYLCHLHLKCYLKNILSIIPRKEAILKVTYIWGLEWVSRDGGACHPLAVIEDLVITNLIDF